MSRTPPKLTSVLCSRSLAASAVSASRSRTVCRSSLGSRARANSSPPLKAQCAATRSRILAYSNTLNVRGFIAYRRR